MRRRRVFAVTLVLLACASIAAPAVARTFRDPYGSSGGAQVSDECGPGKYFVGVVGATGAWIDQIAVLCAELKSDRTFGPAKTIASRGGTGGGFHPAVICPKNQVVTSMNIAVTKDLQVAHLLLVCTGGNLSPTQLTWGGNGPYDRAVGQACIAGEAGKGLNINYGQYVNGIGIICDTWKVPAAPLVSAQFCKDYAARMFGRVQEARRLNCAFLNEYREFNQTRADYEKYCLSYSVDPVATTSDNERRFQFQLDNCKQPPPPANQFVTVLLNVDVYTKPGGADEDRKKDAGGNDLTLNAGTQAVTLLEKKQPWFHVKWPANEGWVYSGAGYVSLKLP